jgi:hypothetical protein
MRRLGMALGAIGLFSSGLLDAQATPLSSSSTLVAQNSSALVQVGCERKVPAIHELAPACPSTAIFTTRSRAS